MSAFFGAVPSIVTPPLSSPAVDASTFVAPAGAAAVPPPASVDASFEPPPHANTDAASATATAPPTQVFRRRMISPTCVGAALAPTVEPAGPRKNVTANHISGRARSFRARFAQFPVDPVRNPVRIPPSHRVDHASADEHREMQMIAAGQAGRVAAADRLAARHLVADIH